jgi:hypothetical protein
VVSQRGFFFKSQSENVTFDGGNIEKEIFRFVQVLHLEGRQPISKHRTFWIYFEPILSF